MNHLEALRFDAEEFDIGTELEFIPGLNGKICVIVVFNNTEHEIQCDQKDVLSKIENYTGILQNDMHLELRIKTETSLEWRNVDHVEELPSICTVKVSNKSDRFRNDVTATTGLPGSNLTEERQLIQNSPSLEISMIDMELAMEKLNKFMNNASAETIPPQPNTTEGGQLIQNLESNLELSMSDMELAMKMLRDKFKMLAILTNASVVSKKHKKVQIVFPVKKCDKSSQTETYYFENYIDRMKVMCEKGSGHPFEMKRLMRLTFEQRRNFILRSSPHVICLKEIYPLLFSRNEVLNELERIFNKGICKNFYENMKNYAEKVLECIFFACYKVEFFQDIISRKDGAEIEDAAIVASILLLELYYKETNGLIHFQDQQHKKTVYPHVKASCSIEGAFSGVGEYNVVVENVVLCTVTDIQDAILCLMAAYYIFNIRFDTSSYFTLMTFERLYLELKTDKSVPVMVRQLMYGLNC